MAKCRANQDCFLSVVGLVDRDALFIDSSWVAILVERPCNARGCIRLLAHNECLRHFHLSGCCRRNSTISLVFLPVPFSMATRFRKSAGVIPPNALAQTSYACLTLRSARAWMGQRFRTACWAAFPHTEQSMMTAYSVTIHYISTLSFQKVQVGIVPADSRAPPPERGLSFLILPIRALFPVWGRFYIYNGRFPMRRNEQ